MKLFLLYKKKRTKKEIDKDKEIPLVMRNKVTFYFDMSIMNI